MDEPYIYADNAATTPLSPTALAAMMPYLTDEFGNPSGVHRRARNAAAALEEAREAVAHALGAADAREVHFTSGGTEADNWALRGAAQRFRAHHGRGATVHIITSAIEHHAVLNCCRALEAKGVHVTYLPVDAAGRVNAAALEEALVANERAAADEAGAGLPDAADAGEAGAGLLDAADTGEQGEDTAGADADGSPTSRPLAAAPARDDSAGSPIAATALVSIMLANNEVGTVQNIAELARVAHAHGAPFHTDAVQAAGHIPVDVAALGVDALSISGHKFHGPKGTGALWIKHGIDLPPLIAGGAQESGLRAGTENVAGIVGMAAALTEACDGLDARMERVAQARDALVAHILDTCPDVQLTGPACGSANGTVGSPSGAGAARTVGTAQTVGGARTSSVAGATLPARLPSIASFVCDGVDGDLLTVLLDRAGVAAATGSACSSGSTEPSHVLLALGIDPARAAGALRLSLADSIAPEELDLLKARVPAAIKRARLVSGL